jgi:ABC-type Fe3+-hydroxamate transport system substrate-binding protein
MSEKKIIDQLERVVTIKHQPSRVVSLVPSQTELLYDLGLDETIVGITKFCCHPAEWKFKKTSVGGTKAVDIEKIRLLQPDLIIGNKEENTLEDIAQLESIAPVWISDVSTIDDALSLIVDLGELLGKQAKANQLVQEIITAFDQLVKIESPLKVAYFIWHSPDFIAGKATFIDSMLTTCGFENVSKEMRYPAWNDQFEIPELVLLSSEPYPFKEKHVALFQEKFPTAKINFVDGEYFSWYGSRLRNAPRYFQILIDSTMEQIKSI